MQMEEGKCLVYEYMSSKELSGQCDRRTAQKAHWIRIRRIAKGVTRKSMCQNSLHSNWTFFHESSTHT